MNSLDRAIVGWTLCLLIGGCLGAMGYMFATGVSVWLMPIVPALWLSYCAHIVFTT